MFPFFSLIKKFLQLIFFSTCIRKKIVVIAIMHNKFFNTKNKFSLFRKKKNITIKKNYFPSFDWKKNPSSNLFRIKKKKSSISKFFTHKFIHYCQHSNLIHGYNWTIWWHKKFNSLTFIVSRMYFNSKWCWKKIFILFFFCNLSSSSVFFLSFFSFSDCFLLLFQNADFH